MLTLKADLRHQLSASGGNLCAYLKEGTGITTIVMPCRYIHHEDACRGLLNFKEEVCAILRISLIKLESFPQWKKQLSQASEILTADVLRRGALFARM